MAKGDSQDSTTSQTTQPSQTPQQNQYLTGNPSTQSNANTLWMNPSQASPTTGIGGGGGAQQAQQTQPIQNGTMLGQITAGNLGQYMTGGWDMNKFNDPNKHDPKYDVGRVLSKYPPGVQGLDAAMGELGPMGYKRISKDTIAGPDGIPIDVGVGFSDPNYNHTWQWSPQGNNNQSSPQGNSASGGMIGSGMNQNDLMNQIYQMIQSQRQQYGQQQFNPTGGYVPPTGGISGMGNGQMNQQPQVSNSPAPQMSYLGGVQQPSQNPIDVLNQMWSGTYQPYRGPQ